MRTSCCEALPSACHARRWRRAYEYQIKSSRRGRASADNTIRLRFSIFIQLVVRLVINIISLPTLRTVISLILPRRQSFVIIEINSNWFNHPNVIVSWREGTHIWHFTFNVIRSYDTPEHFCARRHRETFPTLVSLGILSLFPSFFYFIPYFLRTSVAEVWRMRRLVVAVPDSWTRENSPVGAATRSKELSCVWRVFRGSDRTCRLSRNRGRRKKKEKGSRREKRKRVREKSFSSPFSANCACDSIARDATMQPTCIAR